MKIVDNVEYYSIAEVAEHLERSPRTIKNWYSWAEQEGKLDTLPPIHWLPGPGGTNRYFTLDALPDLVDFRDSITSGKLSSYSEKLWGKRGKEIAKRKKAKQADK